MSKELWKEFWFEGERLCAYTVEGEAEGEEDATVEQLAFEAGCWPDDIDVRIVERDGGIDG